MKVQRTEQVESNQVDMPGATGCQVRWLVGQPDGAPNFAMRQFIVEPGGHTPKHSHPYEHEIYILEGAGVAMEGDQEHPIKSGDFLYVQPDEVHQFRNTGDAPMKFLCLVPHIPEGTPVTLAPECAEPQESD